MYKSKIIGMGYSVPENIISNNDLSKIMDTSDDWIQSRSGIKERRWATNDVSNSEIGFNSEYNAVSIIDGNKVEKIEKNFKSYIANQIAKKIVNNFIQ